MSQRDVPNARRILFSILSVDLEDILESMINSDHASGKSEMGTEPYIDVVARVAL